MATIRLEDVTKIYHMNSLGDRVLRNVKAGEGSAEREGTVTALDRVDLTILDGETVAVVGPTGCGKTTLLRVIAGLEEDYRGHIYYDEEDVRDVPPKERHIGMVFQNYALYPHFTNRGNLSFFFRVHQAPDEETERRIRITSELMGIGFKELLKRKPGTLSSGQQQRVAIARAIVRKPRLFLFDEPLSNLDAKLRVQTRGEIKRLLHRFQITAIYVTHDQTEAVVLGDRLAVMRAGGIEQVGTYHKLRQNPANAFVAGFLGLPPMNLLEDAMVADGKLQLGGITLPLPDKAVGRVRSGQRVILGIRPEAAHLGRGDRSRSEGVRLRGTVEVIEPDFAHRTQLVHVCTGALSYAVNGPLDNSLNTGDQVEVLFPEEQMYFFDAESEQRIVSK